MKQVISQANNIAVYGGGFDPVHKGHLQIIQHLLSLQHQTVTIPFFKKIIVCPTFNHPFAKQMLIDFNNRLELIKKLSHTHFFCEKEEVINNVLEISALEQKLPSPSYTYNLVFNLKKQNPQANIFFVIGSDNIVTLSKWYKIDVLLKEINFLVLPRVGARLPNFSFEFEKRLYNFADYTSGVMQDTTGLLIMLNLEVMQVNSTLIKQRGMQLLQLVGFKAKGNNIDNFFSSASLEKVDAYYSGLLKCLSCLENTEQRKKAQLMLQRLLKVLPVASLKLLLVCLSLANLN